MPQPCDKENSQKNVIYLQQIHLQKGKNHENRKCCCPQKFLPKHMYVNVNVTVPIGFYFLLILYHH